MSARYYRLTVRTSCKSVTAFRLEADGDREAIGKALTMVAKFDSFCEETTFEILRADGTRVQENSKTQDALSVPQRQDIAARVA